MNLESSTIITLEKFDNFLKLECNKLELSDLNILMATCQRVGRWLLDPVRIEKT